MIDLNKYSDVLDSRDDFEKTIDRLGRIMVRDYISNHAANGKFLTEEEYERNRIHINSVHHYIKKLKEHYGKGK